uniref:Uncharacterized protein LOC105115583 n=2 Tax=Rhizophora mucronata TaxID=61149 RepID=A0A2P2KUG1_RHIMU
MHELCEYTKGEGFSEGFDAHLNIEQMNKTSVELFQMYDDHRKKGIGVPTEKEFRGYYALLKLDKHPGYKVEPTELSLDLAKMTPEIRQTPEVLFARNVARACRTGNFIAFFRLARKASYLQACLMHAHFAKLRTQALSSLHAGLQSNQGLPVADIATWLAMEEEDIESLLEYHGFSIKEFEEPYMVKEGPFLNSDKDYPTNYSKLVQLKKSGKIVNDVAQTPQMISLPGEATKEVQLPEINKNETKSIPSLVDGKRPIHEINKEMPNFRVFPSPKVTTPGQSVFGKLILNQSRHQELGAQISPRGSFLARNSMEAQSPKLSFVEKPNHEALMVVSPKRKMPSGTERMPSGTESMPSDVESMPSQIVSRSALQERSLSGKFNRTLEEVNSQIMVTNNLQDLQPLDIHMINKSSDVMEDYEDEVARAKLKLITRLWRRRSSKQRELREERQIAAGAALSLLSLGPPIQQARDQTSTHSKFDIDQIMRERYENHEESWSRLNVSDVVADILGRRNPDAKCLCWKIVLCSQMNYQEGEKERQRSEVMHGAASQWLFSKLMPSSGDDYDDNNDLILSCPGLSIWRRWVPDQSGDDLICCFSVVKDIKFDNLSESISGASAVLFLVSKSIPWNLQSIQLHHLLKSIPYGSALPLLILSGSYHREVSDPSSIIVHELGLNDIDKSQVGSFSIVFLVEDKQMEPFDGFFSDKNLREGLRWLASEAPLQPDLHRMKPLELVLTQLNPSLDFLEKISEYEIGPSHCISAFNESLNWSVGEISTTAKANPVGWPCPEIFLLEDLSDEKMLVKWCLPNRGWSSATTIEPLLCALRNCKLPSFPDIESWLYKGTYLGNEVETLISQLEDCLIRYLTESSGAMGLPLAEKETHLMLQRSTRLELRDSAYYIIPKWIMVFRRIFNWRLSALSNGPWSFVYVQTGHHQNPTLKILEDLDVDRTVPSPHLSQPSLDEMINAGFGLDVTSRQLQPEAFQTQASSVPKGNAVVDANSRVDEEILGQNGYSSVTDNFDRVTSELNTTSTEIAVARKATKEADKLGKLLEQCNMVQNSIDHKLYIYF